jgi:hypothetical protein
VLCLEVAAVCHRVGRHIDLVVADEVLADVAADAG